MTPIGRTLLAFVAALLLAGCSEQTFPFSEAAAIDRLLQTKHVAKLIQAIPERRITCRVDFAMPDAIHLYLGDDEGDHTTRIGFYRCTRDGRVWVNLDPIALEDRWAVIE